MQAGEGNKGQRDTRLPDGDARSVAPSLQLDNPLLEDLGIRLVYWNVAIAEFELDIAGRHLNRQGSLQGGVVATLLDAACGYAGLKLGLGDAMGQDHAATVMLSICYVAKVERGLVRASGTMTGAGRKIYFSAAELRDADGALLATAQGTFKRASVSAKGLPPVIMPRSSNDVRN